jgi:hypothetical protein
VHKRKPRRNLPLASKHLCPRNKGRAEKGAKPYAKPHVSKPLTLERSQRSETEFQRCNLIPKSISHLNPIPAQSQKTLPNSTSP